MKVTPSLLLCALPLLIAALLAAPVAVQAQPSAAPPPPKLEPLPEIPPPPELEPQVTITRKDSETIEEARVAGRVIWIKVTPRHGRSYFLIPDPGGQIYLRRDSLESGLSVPLWVLFTF